MTYTYEKKIEIWNDKWGTKIVVGPDRDGLDLIEISSIDQNGVFMSSITFTKEEAFLVKKALEELLVEEGT